MQKMQEFVYPKREVFHKKTKGTQGKRRKMALMNRLALFLFFLLQILGSETCSAIFGKAEHFLLVKVFPGELELVYMLNTKIVHFS